MKFQIINTKKNKKQNSSQTFVVKGCLQFKLVLAKEPFKRVWFCYWTPQKNIG